MDKLRLGIAGCGIATKKLHLPALRKLEKLFEVTALYNRTERKAHELAAQLDSSPKVFGSYPEMLKSGEIDAVDVSLPPGLNHKFISEALAAGLHVICEKPISNSTAQGKKIVELADKSDKVVYIAENFRHVSRFIEGSRLIAEGRIGRAGFLNYQSWVKMSPDNDYVRTEWRKHPEHIGGYLSDGGVHHIAAIRVLVGDIAEVTAMTMKITDYLGAEDTVSSVLLSKTGVLVSYNASYALHRCGMSAKIVGSDGCVSIEDSSVVLNSAAGQQTFEFDSEDSYEKEFADFYATVFGKPDGLGSPLSALHDLAVIEAAVVSSRTSKRVLVDSLL